MRLLTFVTAAALGAGALVAGPVPAATSGVSSFTLTSGFRDIVVDQDHGRVFLSGGSVVVADLDGTLTGSIDGITGARQMALTADGGALVVANGDGLTVVDPATATVVRTIETGPGSCPDAIAPAAGKMFFSYGACAAGPDAIGAVDLETDVVSTGLHVIGSRGYVDLDSVPAAPNLLAATLEGDPYLYTVTGGETPALTPRAAGGFAEFIALNPAGTRFFMGAESSPWQERSTSDLSVVRSVSSESHHTAAVRGDGLVGIGGVSNSVDVAFFKPGAKTPTRTVEFGSGTASGGSPYLQRGGLAFGDKLAYAVTGNLSGGALRLRTIVPGAAPSLVVTSDKYAYSLGSTATVAATLGTTDTLRTVSIYATSAGGKQRLIKTAPVSPTSGKLVVKVPNMTRNTWFVATFAGDDDNAPTSARKHVKVRATIKLSSVSTSMSGMYHRLKASPAPIVSGQVSPANPGRCVRATGQRLVGSTWKTIGVSTCLRTTSTSRFGVKLIGFPKGTKLRVTAKLASTDLNAANLITWYYVVLV